MSREVAVVQTLLLSQCLSLGYEGFPREAEIIKHTFMPWMNHAASVKPEEVTHWTNESISEGCM